MLIKEILSTLAISLTLFAFIPYILSIHRGDTKPHVFSWVIWGSTTLVVSLAQLAGGGGLGAWPITVSGVVTLYVALLAYLKKADTTCTKLDYIFLLAALSALPLWYLANDPLAAVLILTFVDVLGFGPTFRKSYGFPYSERLLFFAILTARNVIAIFALEKLTLTTILFPVVTAFVCIAFMLMVLFRRLQLKNPEFLVNDKN